VYLLPVKILNFFRLSRQMTQCGTELAISNYRSAMMRLYRFHDGLIIKCSHLCTKVFYVRVGLEARLNGYNVG
jgi:hypothetical protein